MVSSEIRDKLILAAARANYAKIDSRALDTCSGGWDSADETERRIYLETAAIHVDVVLELLDEE